MSTTYVTSLMVTGCLRPSTVVSRPIIEAKIEKVPLSICIQSKMNLTSSITLQSPDSYWKYKIITHISTVSSIISISFIPKNISDNVVLFLQKIPEEFATSDLLCKETLTAKDVSNIIKIGLVVPCLSEKEQLEWGASSAFNGNITHLNQDNLEESVKDLDEDIKKCVEYFFKDSTTSCMSLFYFSQKKATFVTEAWTKLFC